ncbi:ferredoxin hydrogenase large subunit [Humidesulfovibrio mexicanus]|uniref:Ferredoxin hydrogenase large subunit n=1 Tax=Humidesulfovibrio mexicanus TaxID=147047 RepID=A0A239A791_9BACT|nr:ferredoxin hydrogenase large subunit [Humidesulfovibrio mexicanus]
MQEMEKVMMKGSAPKNVDPNRFSFVQVDAAKCEACGTCDEVCKTGAIQPVGKDEKRQVVDPAACINCGQCLVNCPYGAIYEEVSFVDEVFKALKDPDTIVVSMPAPAVRYSLGEAFGMPPGTHVGGKMHAALRKLGFKYVWDNEYTADLTIMEEGTELLNRVKHPSHHAPLPQFTSCCPGWVKFVESFYPELLPHVSSARSPIAMLGPLAKTYGAKETKTNPAKIFTVSIMPCIAKKYEGLRPEMSASGYRDIDATITTRELAYMIKKAGIDFNKLKDEEADPVLGMATGAATIFGTSGGVMEAALRLAYEVLSGDKLANVDLKAVRAHEGIKTASIDVPKFGKVNVAVASGLDNAKKLCDEVKAGKSPHHFIEIMTCPGGCVNGGGQILNPSVRTADSGCSKVFAEINKRLAMRAKA